MIYIYGRRGARARVVRELRAFARWYRTRHPVSCRVTVSVWPKRILGIDDSNGRGVNGEFWADPRPRIAVAGGGEDYLDTLAHELVHYEQWMRGGVEALTERGVAVRARNLVRRWREESA